MNLTSSSDPNSISSQLRRKRDLRLRALIQSIYDAKGEVSVLDVGGTIEYWRRVGLDFLRERKTRIVVTNLHASELIDPGADQDVLSAAVANACDLSAYADGSFDLVHSNSVIEHVGGWSNARLFAAETRRVGRAYYVQTPNFWFPVDPHYYKAPLIHWFPHPIRARLFNTFPITYAGRIKGVDNAYNVIDGTRLLDSRQFQHLFSDAEMSIEWVFGLPKSLIAIRRAES